MINCAARPWGLERQLRRSLSWVGEAELEGLAGICLEDELPGATGEWPEWARRAAEENFHVGGWYAPAGDDGPAHITLYVRHVYGAIPPWHWWTTVPTLRIVRTLAHEVAHHLIATGRTSTLPGAAAAAGDEEEVANLYAEGVVRRMEGRWAYRWGQRRLKKLAEWHYAFGIADWRGLRYEAAARHFFNAWDLDPTHETAAYWYWRAKEMCRPEPKAPPGA